ncbi:MAG: hypothetical protein GKS00_04050 [Alphaproteobacteria bacterium]|nr:hypothetical protein [Alphaproteobacteria bacterium]
MKVDIETWSEVADMLLTKSCESAVDLLKNRRDDLSNWLTKSALNEADEKEKRAEAKPDGAYYMMGYVAAMNDVLALFGRSGQPKR